jgi:hypothetical protein
MTPYFLEAKKKENLNKKKKTCKKSENEINKNYVIKLLIKTVTTTTKKMFYAINKNLPIFSHFVVYILIIISLSGANIYIRNI